MCQNLIIYLLSEAKLFELIQLKHIQLIYMVKISTFILLILNLIMISNIDTFILKLNNTTFDRKKVVF
jgi:hypothetical protein